MWYSKGDPAKGRAKGVRGIQGGGVVRPSPIPTKPTHRRRVERVISGMWYWGRTSGWDG